MSNQIRMSPEKMRQRAAETTRQSETVQGVIKTMDRLLLTLKSEWEGEAMRGYEERYNKIKPSFQNAKELLDEISQNLKATAKAIEETDRTIGNQYRGN